MVFRRFLKRCLVCSKVKLDQMVMFLNWQKIEPFDMVWMSHASPCGSCQHLYMPWIHLQTSTYGMFNTSMINFVCLGVAKNYNQHKIIFKKQMVWIDLDERSGYMGLAFCCGCFKNFVILLAQSSTNWLASIEEQKVGVSLYPLLIIFSIKKI